MANNHPHNVMPANELSGPQCERADNDEDKPPGLVDSSDTEDEDFSRKSKKMKRKMLKLNKKMLTSIPPRGGGLKRAPAGEPPLPHALGWGWG